MKSRVLAPAVFSCCLFGQAVPPPSPAGTPPPAPASPASPVPANIPDDAVVARVAGKDITAAEARRLVAGAPPQLQQAMTQNPQPALEYLVTVQKLHDLATEDKILEREPWKDQIQYNLKQMVAQAEVNYRMNEMRATDAEQKAAYESSQDKFGQAKIHVIYVGFSADPNAPKRDDGKKPLTEAEAKAKAEDLLKQLRAGADFAKLARENSDDKSSAEKGGDFGQIRQSDPLAAEIKTAVFQTKAGEFAGPVKQPSGFYIIRVDERSVRPFAEVRDDLVQQVKQEKFQKWMQSIREQSKVTVEKPEFFKSGAAAH